MSEFPEWVEARQSCMWSPSYQEAKDLHQALGVIRRYAPDLDERMEKKPSQLWRWPIKLNDIIRD